MIDMSGWSMLVVAGVFIVGAVAVGFAGTKMARYADFIAERTGASDAVIGVLLLAGVTSLPEVATSFSASAQGDADLAVNNLLGSVAMQVAVLAVGDFLFGRGPLTSIVPNPIVLLQGSLNVCLLTLVALAVVVGDVGFIRTGPWALTLGAGAIYAFIKVAEGRGRRPWLANRDGEEGAEEKSGNRETGDGAWQPLIAKVVVAAAVVLAGGVAVTYSGQAIAERTGLGSSFVGVALVAIATSLPEASTCFAAMHRGNHTMAISDIFGTNILNVALILGVDLIEGPGPVIEGLGNFSAVAALLGTLLTGFFMVGIAERRDRTVFRMGIDSAMVIVTYAAGLFLLYTMRGSP